MLFGLRSALRQLGLRDRCKHRVREYLWKGLPPSPIRSHLTGALRPGRNLFVVYAKGLRFASMVYADRDHILRGPAAWSLQVRGSFLRTRYRFAARLRKADAG